MAGRELCVTLVHGEPAHPRARICVTRRSGRTALDLTPLGPDGTALAPRVLTAVVSRPAPDVLEATFLPAAAGLPIGPFAWYADSAWTDAATCAATCRDRAPDAGAVAADVVLLAVAPCFGAAARDPARPCDNPALRSTVEPAARPREGRRRSVLRQGPARRAHHRLQLRRRRPQRPSAPSR